MANTQLTEIADIQKLLDRARWAQFGPDWSLTHPDRGAYIARIQSLANILGEVTNVLESMVIVPAKPKNRKGGKS
jgi:hypothetical protein